MTDESTVTAERLRELLDYDPETGIFRWRVDRGDRYKAGTVAGGRTQVGYWHIRVDGRLCQAHQLAWLHVHGVWPDGFLDHRNEDKADNRIANLREANKVQNGENITASSRRSKSGYRGVTRHQKGWRATIRAGGKWRLIGTYTTAEEASAAYLAAKAELHSFWANR